MSDAVTKSAVSHWLYANLESALKLQSIKTNQNKARITYLYAYFIGHTKAYPGPLTSETNKSYMLHEYYMYFIPGGHAC